MNAIAAKSLDHLVLPVGSLDIARERLTVLGFTVAPDGYHPFGTGNCCVFFRNDTYLEPLAIVDAEVAQHQATKGNRFVARDRLYRNRNSNDGFSMIALGSNDAVGDVAYCRKRGFECGEMVAFERDVVRDDGTKGKISVQLFIASIEACDDFALFYCQWLSGKAFDDKYKIHANGALGIHSIALVGADTAETIDYLSSLTGQSGKPGNTLSLQNASILLMSLDEFFATYGYYPDNTSLRAVAFDIEVENIMAVRYVLFATGIASQIIGNRLVVQPAEGQGYGLGFVETQDAQS